MRIIKTLISALLMMSAAAAQAQMLKCDFRNHKMQRDNISAFYSSEGTTVTDREAIMRWDADGSFTIDIDCDKADITFYVGDDDTFGAHVERGKTSLMTITRDSDGRLTASFSGDNADISHAVCVMTDAYVMTRYFPMTGPTPSMAENKAMLERMQREVSKAVSGIRDRNARAEYQQFNDYQFRFTLARIAIEEAYRSKTKAADYAEYQTAIAGVDLNSDMAYRTYLSQLVLDTCRTIQLPKDKKMEAYCRETMDICDKYVTNSKLRRTVVKDLGKYYFGYGDGSGDYEKFYRDAMQWAGADSALIAQYKPIMKSWKKTKTGGKAPDITLTDAEGKTVQLLDVIKGKFAYIDVWATWCGPCKKEIPHFAKLAARHDGRDDIIFISISVDENVKAWKKMIDEEKPSWLQFNINGQTYKTFSEQWGITGIPRFIMIDRQGNIKAADAHRPSTEAAEEILKNINND